MIRQQGRFFHLCDGAISYILEILDDGTPGHVYFGAAMADLELEDLEYMARRCGKSTGTVKAIAGTSFSLADQMLEYPVYGTTSFLEPALAMEQEGMPLYLRLAYTGFEIRDGKEKSMPGPQTRPDPKAQSLILHLADRDAQVEVDLSYTIYMQGATVVRSAKITNLANCPRNLTHAASGVLNVRDTGWNWIHLNGSWARERQIVEQALVPGTAVIESLTGASSHQCNPWNALVKSPDSPASCQGDNNLAYGCNLVYSSNFKAQADINEFGLLRVMEGIHPLTFGWTLQPLASFQTPEMLLFCSIEGLDGLSRVSSRFLRDHLINPNFVYKRRPVCLNSWEAVYFTLNEQNLLELAREAAKCGIDCFVVDDGWFGHRDLDNSSLGDWYPDQKKFPSGLDAFARQIRSLGMQFGLWFEPEMISEDSELYGKHPQWAVKPPAGQYSVGRSQLVLDFSCPEVVEYIFRQMCQVIESTKLSYIKWDMNRSITEAYSQYLAQEKEGQKEFFYRYIYGVYALYEKLTEAYPDVLIEGCAAGGGRFDPGILYYSPQIWTSDNTDAFDRLKIQYATSLAYPLSTLSNHISQFPSHQTGRTFTSEFQKDVALFGIFGYELNLIEDHRFSPADLTGQIGQYRQMEPAILHGDFYHLASPFASNEPAVALYWDGKRPQSAPKTASNSHQVLSKQEQAFVGFYQTLSSLHSIYRPALPLPFLADGQYLIQPLQAQSSMQLHLDLEEENPGKQTSDSQSARNMEPEVIRGQLLRHDGLRKPVKNNGSNRNVAQFIGDFQAMIIELKKIG